MGRAATFDNFGLTYCIETTSHQKGDSLDYLAELYPLAVGKVSITREKLILYFGTLVEMFREQTNGLIRVSDLNLEGRETEYADFVKSIGEAPFFYSIMKQELGVLVDTSRSTLANMKDYGFLDSRRS
ncbi:MAG: hypothetical protein JJ975_06695 [Bacteroidia bacterium]|nr:hypothetical protein [Bacteroidia bacterium]